MAGHLIARFHVELGMPQSNASSPEPIRPELVSDTTRWRLLRLVDVLVDIAGNKPSAELPVRDQEAAEKSPAASGEAA